jgi:hypothetical protein
MSDAPADRAATSVGVLRSDTVTDRDERLPAVARGFTTRLVLTTTRWWRGWNVVIRIGCVEVPITAHVLAIAVLGLLAWSAALQVSDAAALALTSTNAAAVAVLLYTLLQAGRIIHEAGHAVAGVATGRRPRLVRLTPLLTVTDIPDWQLEPAHARGRRLIGLAGSTLEAGFGLVFLASGRSLWGVLGARRAGNRVLVRRGHVAALANLLPIRQMDGALLFGRAWQTRPAWLGLSLVVLLTFPARLVLTALYFPHGYTHAYLTWLTTPSGYVPLALAALILFPLTRHLLMPRASSRPEVQH